MSENVVTVQETDNAVYVEENEVHIVVGTALVGPPGPQGPQGTPGVGSGDLNQVQEMIDTSVGVHVQTSDPHPAYDDMPSLTLIFENGLI